MATSLIKGRIRGNSEKCCNCHNERMRVGSQICKIFHAPKLLIECVFKPNFKGLNEKIEMHYETKTRKHACIASRA